MLDILACPCCLDIKQGCDLDNCNKNCMVVCSENAIIRNNNVLSIDYEKCTGCLKCNVTCDENRFNKNKLKLIESENCFQCDTCKKIYYIINNIVVLLPEEVVIKENILEQIKQFKREIYDIKEKYIEKKYFNYFHFLRFKHYKEMIDALNKADDKSFFLDLGCATGAAALYFEKDKYIGLDRDLKRLLFASLNKDQFFILGDIHKIPFMQGAIKKLISVDVLEHTEDYESSFRNINFILGGKGIIGVPIRDEFHFLDDPINFIRIKMGKSPIEFSIFNHGHINMPYYYEWKAYMKNAGIKIYFETFWARTLISKILNLITAVIFWKTNFDELPVDVVKLKTFKRITKLFRLISLFDIPLSGKKHDREFYIERKLK